MKIAVVTTFHDEGYQIYGHKMLRSLERYWPEEVEIWAYYETLPVNANSFHRVNWCDLHKASEALVNFKKKYSSNDMATGRSPGKIGFRWDAVRFSHKIFCLHSASMALRDKVDVLIWLDADVFSFKKLPLQKIISWLPTADEAVSYLGRANNYSECGFVGYNLKNESTFLLLQRLCDLYTEGSFLSYDEWHDSYLFDQIRLELERSMGVRNRNLSAGLSPKVTHPFINSDLGVYMDHVKGTRKEKGKSFASDLVPEVRRKRWGLYWLLSNNWGLGRREEMKKKQQ